MMDFYIKQIIIHQFSPNDTELVLSDTPLTLTPRIDDYFRKKLSKVFSDEAKRGYFGEDNVFMSHLQDDLYVSSCQIAQLWKEEFVIADIILVMVSGEIVEVGNHSELMAQKGIYYQMQNAQK